VDVRVTNEQIIQAEFTQRLAELSARVAELSHRVDAIEFGRGQSTAEAQTQTAVYEPDEWSNPIEFLTENGFVIVRPWETDGSPPPADGCYRFDVTGPDGNERKVTVTVSTRLHSETTVRTQGRIDLTSSFWICCAERRLAGYLEEQDGFPAANEIIVDEFDREDTLLAIRWGKSG